MKTLLLLVVLCAGCTSVSMDDRQREIAFRASIPLYPWQDGKQLVNRVNISARGTNLTMSLRDLSQDAATSSNFVYMIERVVGAAVKAAIEATIKP